MSFSTYTIALVGHNMLVTLDISLLAGQFMLVDPPVENYALIVLSCW